ncbi:MAG: hypothetical protein L6R36_006779 [Xanthoria steineri]|nr:MAG: hypothetical protein L6R36_006779 [Xanthoria steineri]
MITNGDRDKPNGNPTSTGHRKSISGALLSKLSFSSPSQDGSDSHGSSTPNLPSPAQTSPRSPRAAGGAMAAALKQTKTRKRKGSLRKTALLGTGRLRTDQATNNSEVNAQGDDDVVNTEIPSEPQSSEDLPTPTPLPPKVQPPVPWVSHPVHGILHKALIEHTPAGKSLQKSPTRSSTTDEEDILHQTAAPLTAQKLPTLPAKASFSSGSSTSDGYFPPQVGALPRRTRHSPKSPLSTVAAEALPSPEAWDYSETRWWGWVVLVVTWVVFVVGMGSCLGVWSWAWDVGETPKAPPEFEDDATLPIVGYYPALIILTGFMAWVWVTVAWVGMKYFKHAKMGGEDEV